MSVPTYQSNQNLVLNNAFGSNVNNSTVLTSFPSTSTTAQGHYHFTDTSTNALKLLNASNDKVGGHEFWNSNSTSVPVKTLDVNKDRLLLNSKLNVSDSSNNIVSVEPTNLSIANSSTNNNITLINDLVNPALTLTNTAFQQGTFATGGVTITNNNNSTESILQSFQATISQNTVSTILQSDSIRFQDTASTKAIYLNNTITSPFIRTNDTTSGESILTATDITFGGVSVLTQIEELQIKQTNLINVYSSPAIYADGRPPASVPLTSSNTYAQFGWYFKNTVAGYKINWYFPPDTNQTVGDVLGLYLRLFNCSTTSNDNTPFIIIYTKPTGSGDYASWYHSSMVYILDQTITPTINTSYTFFKNVSGTCPNPAHYSSSLVNMIQSPVNNPRGTYLPTEQILTIAIGSNSASAVNSVEFIGQSLGLITANGTTQFNLGFQL
jgi:hypothetical protein